MKKIGIPFHFMREMNGRTIKVLSMIVLMIAMNFNAHAAIAMQGNRIDIHEESIDLEDLIWKIEEISEYKFIYNTKHLAEYRNLKVIKKGSIEKVLKEVLSDTDLTYTLKNGTFVICRADEKPQKQTQKRSGIKLIKGKVLDADTGEPLPGVNVVVKGNYLGTSTNVNGEFTIRIPNKLKHELVFSFIGFESKTVSIKDKTNLTVRLKSNITELDDVVITGYQVINKRELTSAISSVNADELNQVGALTVDHMLEGKATGLMITTNTATPGAAAKVRVRSGSTFTGNQEPLWVIDGVIYEAPVPLSANDINSFDNINIIGNALTGLNPVDIAKIDILKDASATAIYGTRAANGVIVITTKRGKKGRPTLTYNGSMRVVQAPSYSDFNLMNSKERVDVSREMYRRNLGYPGNYNNLDRLGYAGALKNLWDGTYNFGQFQKRVSDLESMNSDWFGELYRPVINHAHSLSASGGSENARYRFSLGYDENQGTEKGVETNRITARANVDLDLRENVLLSFNFEGSVQEGTYNHGSVNVFDQAYYTSRTIPIYDENGDYFYTSKEIFRASNSGSENGTVYGRYNILNEMKNSERNIINKGFSISAILNWKLNKNFEFNTRASYRNTSNLNEEWITEDTWYVAKLRTYDAFENMIKSHVKEGSLVPFGGVYSGGMTSSKTYSITNQLNYKKVFNNDAHVLNVNLGQEARSVNYWGANGFKVPGYNHSQGRGFIKLPKISGRDSYDEYDYKNMLKWLTVNGGQSIYPTISDSKSNTLSFYGMVTYQYDNRYVFNVNARSDGSNTFGQYERYKFKPAWSASTRWNIHNEKFWNKDGKIDELAFRASFGVRGTMPNATPYLIIADYGRNDATYYPEHTANLSSFPNANLRWEKSSTLNLGLNYSLFSGRISGAFDFGYTKSTDLLMSRPVSLVNGKATQEFNGGSKSVSSYEFSIRSVNIRTDKFSWSTHLNFSHNKDRVLKGFEQGATDLTVTDYLNGRIHRKGFPTNGFFSYRFNGLNKEGLPTFKHLVEEDMTPEQQLKAALVYEGSRAPKYHGGFGTDLRYGNLRLSASFTYKLGYKTRLLSLYNGNQNLPLPYQNMHSDFNKRWRQPGDEARTNIPGLSNNNMSFIGEETSDSERVYVTNSNEMVPSGSNAWWMYDKSDIRVVRGDHIRLTSISLRYNVPRRWYEKAGMKNLTLGLTASNVAVWVFDKDLDGQDPEQVNKIGLPNLPSYSFSLSMSF